MQRNLWMEIFGAPILDGSGKNRATKAPSIDPRSKDALSRASSGRHSTDRAEAARNLIFSSPVGHGIINFEQHPHKAEIDALSIFLTQD